MRTQFETVRTNLWRKGETEICPELRSRSKNNKKNLEADLSFHITSQHCHNLPPGHDYRTRQRPSDSHFSQDDQRCDNSSSLSHDIGSFSLSNTISSVDLTTWGPDVRCHNQSGRSMGSTDTTAVVTTRRGVARSSQVGQDGSHERTFEVLAPYLSTTEGSESICRVGKLLEMSASTLDREARLLERGEDPTRESSGEGGHGQEDGRAEEQGFPICPKTASATSPGSHSRTNERSVEKRSTEQARVRSWTRITSPHGSSEQQHQRSPRGGVLKGQTGTTSRVLATHVGAAVTDAAGSSATGVCSDGSHSTARRNTTSSNGMDIRGDAAKDLARVVRDGSTSEGQRLREQLWVWLHLQDEEATEPVPKQIQSWLTGQKTQQRKEFKRNRRHHSSQVDLKEIFSPPRIIPHAVRQGLRTTTPTNLNLTEDWDATTVTGRDRLKDILTLQKPWMATLKPPCAPFSNMFRLNERMQDSREQVRTQENALEFLEVAMWVALTQHQAGRKFLFEHPAYASSWNTEMVSFVAGLEGVTLVTVDLCTLGMAEKDERSHRRTTTLVTNDTLVADTFRPYRCARDHNHVSSAGGRRSRGAQEHDRQFCEVLIAALKASLLHRDRREPSQLITLAVRNDDEQEEDFGLDEDEPPADHQRPTETQIKMVNQYHRNLGHPSRREFLKVLKAAHTKPAVLEYVRREYRCADCDAHTKPQPSRKAAIPRTYEFNRIIALDVFYIPLRGQSLLVLNIICHGTNFQVAALMRQDGTPTAALVGPLFSGHGGATSAHQTS